MPPRKVKPETTVKKKKTVKTSSRKLPRGFKPSTKFFNDFEKMVHKTAEEIEEYLVGQYREEDDNFKGLPTEREMMFCHAYLSNGFKQGPAIAEILPDLKTSNRIQRAHDYLARPRVQKYLTRELHNRRLRMGVTADWICKKYLVWSTLDITQFLDFVPAKEGKKGRTDRRASIYLKEGIEKLPPLVRQAIKAITIDDKGKVKIEFIDQKSALDSLAKMLGYTNDKIIPQTPIHLHFDAQDNEA